MSQAAFVLLSGLRLTAESASTLDSRIHIEGFNPFYRPKARDQIFCIGGGELEE